MNPDSSAPTHRHADTLRQQGLFQEVVCCFWKEEPNMREVFEMVESETIYIVPNFISEGYFCQQVLPRELRLDGPITQRDGRTLYYCDPVGVHRNMTRLLLQRADEVAPGVPRGETSLIIVGHGTNLNDNSTKAIQDQVLRIREGGYGFAEVHDAYMEETPFVADWHLMTKSRHVVVVPFFIADGLHSYQDIPVLLGMEKEPGKALSESEVFRRNPIELQGRQLYFSGAIGTEPLMAEVILDQVHDFDTRHGIQANPSATSPAAGRFANLSPWFEGQRQVLGQVVIQSLSSGAYHLFHLEDEGIATDPNTQFTLQSHRGPIAAREIATTDADNQFRPLRTAPNLKRGWLLELANLQELLLALDFLYPAALGMLLAQQKEQLQTVPLRDLLARQTGMYRFANTISDEQALTMISDCCETATRCLRRIAWPLRSGEALSGPAAVKANAEAGHVPGQENALPLLCMEGCTHIVSAARQIARDSAEAKKAAQHHHHHGH